MALLTSHQVPLGKSQPEPLSPCPPKRKSNCCSGRTLKQVFNMRGMSLFLCGLHTHNLIVHQPFPIPSLITFSLPKQDVFSRPHCHRGQPVLGICCSRSLGPRWWCWIRQPSRWMGRMEFEICCRWSWTKLGSMVINARNNAHGSC